MNNLKTVFLIKSNRSAYLQLACVPEWISAPFRKKIWFNGRNCSEFWFCRAVILVRISRVGLEHSWRALGKGSTLSLLQLRACRGPLCCFRPLGAVVGAAGEKLRANTILGTMLRSQTENECCWQWVGYECAWCGQPTIPLWVFWLYFSLHFSKEWRIWGKRCYTA